MHWDTFLRSLLVLALALTLCVGKEVIVDNYAGGIQAAIAAADDGDDIVIPSGTYTGYDNLNLMLASRSLSFRSQTGNAADVILDGQKNNAYTAIQVMYNSSTTGVDYSKPTNISFTGITFQDGGTESDIYETVGGTIYINTTNIATVYVYITNCVFNGGYADVGGVIYAEAETGGINLFITGSTFKLNSGEFGAAMSLYDSSAVIHNSTFELSASYFGSIYGNNATIDMIDTVMKECLTYTARNYVTGGAGIYVGNTSTVYIESSSFLSNTGDNGASILLFANSVLTIVNSQFVSGDAYYGGAIYNDGCAVTIRGTTFSQNEAESGGAIATVFAGTTVISDSTFHKNKVDLYGGALFVDGDNVETHLTSTNSVFVGNYAGLKGGAIHCQLCNAVITNSEFVGNAANTDFGEGGVATLVRATFTISTSNVTTNSAYYGAGFYLDGSTLLLSNTSVTGNIGTTGGAVYVGASSTLSLSDSVISNNQGSKGSEVYCEGGTITVSQSSIIPSVNRTNEKNGVYCVNSPSTTCSFTADNNDWSNVCVASSSSSNGSSGLARWKIAVIVIFVLVGVAIIVTVAIIVAKKRKAGSSKSFTKM